MLDPEIVIKAAGYIGIFAVVFAESGLLIGIVLPGDSLLFTAGFFAAQGWFGLSIVPLALGCFLAAVSGDSVGYTFGRRVGPRLFRREESLLFSKSNLEIAQAFYEAHGGKTIVLARFIPVVRTFAPILAGVGKMNYRQFLIYNLIGGAVWAIGLTGLGYSLGSIPGMESYIEYVILGIIVVSVLPPVWHILSSKKNRDSISRFIKSKLGLN